MAGATLVQLGRESVPASLYKWNREAKSNDLIFYFYYCPRSEKKWGGLVFSPTQKAFGLKFCTSICVFLFFGFLCA